MAAVPTFSLTNGFLRFFQTKPAFLHLVSLILAGETEVGRDRKDPYIQALNIEDSEFHSLLVGSGEVVSLFSILMHCL